MLYKMAHEITRVRRIIIGTIGIIIAAIGAIIVALLEQSPTEASQSIAVKMIMWFGQWGFLQRLLLLFFLACLSLFLLSEILVAYGTWQQDKRGLQSYLKTVVYDNEKIGPRGIASPSIPLISVDLPLDDIFIPLSAACDKPIYDAPSTYQDLRDELHKHPGLTDEEREELIGRLVSQWTTQPLPGSGGVSQQQDLNALILQGLAPEKPAAIILGSPGSGKSTALRWLALKMAQGKLSPRQIPILIRVSDYASRLSQEEDLPFSEFLNEHLCKMYPKPSTLSAILLKEFAAGNCLLLLDGLDEAADDALRRRVAKNIAIFVRGSAAEHSASQHYNRFVISSRIASYKPGELDQFTHYTLCDLTDQQINDFLKAWCPAVERHLTRESSIDQMARAERIGMAHYQQSIETLQNNPNIKRLAVNPLMLTILALVQRQNIPLPRRRIDLYRVVTRTLLESWNRDSLHPVIPREEIQLAEIMLSNLAYHLHTAPIILNQEEVFTIARKTMAEFYQLPEHQVSDSDQFIDKLRKSSGLFVKAGPDLYAFMHRTFREYFVALYLRPKPLEDLKLFIEEHYRSPIWHEPFLLLIAYKGGSNNRNEVPHSNELIRKIAVTGNEFDHILCRPLIFAANSIIDCNVWLIDKKLQQSIACHLLDRYGECFTFGRYTQLQQEIERVMLLWLRAQPQAISQRNLLPALLNTWRTALCDDANATRQEGATRLLAILAPDLPECPAPVRQALLPPLLSLARLEESPSYPDWIAKELQAIQANPSSLRVQDYACTALRRLGTAGPAGWLRDTWLKEQHRTLFLERLSAHSQECKHLLTPAALPNKSSANTWHTQRSLRQSWQAIAQDKSRDLQRELLTSAETVRYPYAYLLEQLFLKEQEHPTEHWRDVWYRTLRDKMACGGCATYQPRLVLRIIISSDNDQRKQETVEEFIATLTGRNGQQEQASLIATHLCLQDILPLRYVQYPLFLHHRRFNHYVAFLRQRQIVQNIFMQNASLSIDDVDYLKYMLPYLPDMQELEDRQDLLSLRHPLDRASMVNALCNVLEHQTDVSPMVLLALYNLLTAAPKERREEECKKVRQSIDAFEHNRRASQTECDLLLSVLHPLIDVPTPANQSGCTADPPCQDGIATAIYKLSTSIERSAQEVEMLLNACADTRLLSDDARNRLGAKTVHQLAWSLLTRQFILVDV